MILSIDAPGSQAGGLVVKATDLSGGGPVVYLTEDRSVNKLIVSLVNTTGRDLPLKGGAPLPEKEVKHGGPAAVYLVFGSILTADQTERLSMVAPEGWEKKFFRDKNASWGFTPKSDMIFAKDSTIVFMMGGIVASGSPRTGSLTVNHHNIADIRDGWDSLKVMVQNPPSVHRTLKLHYGFIGDDRVYTTQDAHNPLANKLRFFISNPSPTDPIVPAGTKWGPTPPSFHLSFVYGDSPGYGALCDLTQGSHIEVAPGMQYGDRWGHKPNDDDDHPYWKLIPKDHEILGTGLTSTVEFHIGNIVSDLEPGITMMYIQYANIPGYDDGYFALSINKEFPEPGIHAFDIDEANINAGDEIHLSWTTFAAATVELTFEAEGRIRKLSTRTGDIHPNESRFSLRPQANTMYTLNVYDVRGVRAGNPAQRMVSVNNVKIQTFSAIPDMIREGQQVELRWSTLNADHCTLSPGDVKLPPNSSAFKDGYKITPPKGQPGYQLTAWKESRASVPRTVLFSANNIPPEFPVPPFPLTLYPVRPVNPQWSSDWARGMLGLGNWMLAVGHYNANRHFVESVAGGVIGLKGPIAALDTVFYIAVKGKLAETVRFVCADEGPITSRGWDGSNWIDGEATEFDGYYWYRLEAHWKPSPVQGLFTITACGGNINVWAFARG